MSGVSWNTLCSFIGAPVGLACLLYAILTHKPRKDVKGKVVLITGASSGLGEACAKAFHKAGCKLILSGRNLEQLKRVKDELMQNKSGFTPELLIMDIQDLSSIPQKIDEAMKLFGGVDILVNNAGISFRGSAEEASTDIIVKVMTVNFFGQAAVTKAVLSHMLKKGEGCIVGISSVQGKIAIPYRCAYGASKHACQAYYDSLRAEIEDRNIDVCVISPSYIQTNLSLNAVQADGSQLREMEKSIASGMKADYVANEILRAVIQRKKDVVLGPLLHKAAIYLRTLAPTLFFKAMYDRARKESKEMLKNK